ncbi:ABC transporter substrate-binding protein [Kribbella sp. NPDC058245]|uniref:ABC transporter substrate-binding protein n=1 Tax=Kribbella sp. NPDC058245 TaxID=3346399 RepID=UPI0036E24385
MHRSSLVAGSAAALTLLLGACGGPSAPAASSSVVKIGITTEAGSNYDPVTNPNAFATGYLSPVFDTLLTRTDAGGFAPGLATSYTVAPSGKTVTLALRPGVTFQDGAKFDAAAVVTNLERARTAKNSVVKLELATVTKVLAVNPSTVEIDLSGGAGALLGSLTGRVGMMGSPAKLTDPSFPNKPIGAGPWKVSDESVVGQRMVYTAYDGYWDKSVQKVQRIELSLVTAESMGNALLGGQIDIGSVEGRRDMIPQLTKAGFTQQNFPAIPYEHMLYLRKTGPLADVRVRQAISLAIDRDALNSQVLESACTPQAAVQALPQPSTGAAPKADLAAAKQLLAEAGYPQGLDVKVVVSSAGPGSKILQAMQGQLAKAGVRLSINPMARAQLLSTYVGGGADGYFTVNTGDADPASLVAQLSTTLSPGGFSDPVLNGLAAKGANTVDAGARTKAYTDWNQRFTSTAFGIGICNLQLPYMVRSGIDGLKVGSPLHIDPRGLQVRRP